MTIRNKILIYFSSTVIALSAITLTVIYILLAEYREEEFQQRQNEKIQHTIRFLSDYKQMSENLYEVLDEQTIHDFYDEKMMVFNSRKERIFSSLDDLSILKYKKILEDLSAEKTWIETKEEDYDVVGIYTVYKGEGFYGVSKAYDDFGYSKINFLRRVLIGIFIGTSLIVILLSFYLSNKISKPITDLAGNLNKYYPGSGKARLLKTDTSSFELEYLTSRFNQMLIRTNEAFDFQKNAINHISHELKTPITVLVSELEKTLGYDDIEKIKSVLKDQINRATSLGNIIHVLLEISKVESGQSFSEETVRIDELVFDLIADLNLIHPDFHFEIHFSPENFNENHLNLNGNEMLLKQMFKNLLSNCIGYSENRKGEIIFDSSSSKELIIQIRNRGKTISKEQQPFIFDHFFRGDNSSDKSGFGLGLVLAEKIITLLHGKITYQNPEKNLNVFEIRFPLS